MGESKKLKRRFSKTPGQGAGGLASDQVAEMRFPACYIDKVISIKAESTIPARGSMLSLRLREPNGESDSYIAIDHGVNFIGYLPAVISKQLSECIQKDFRYSAIALETEDTQLNIRIATLLN